MQKNDQVKTTHPQGRKCDGAAAGSVHEKTDVPTERTPSTRVGSWDEDSDIDYFHDGRRRVVGGGLFFVVVYMFSQNIST